MASSEKERHVDAIETTHNEAGGTLSYAAERGQVATDKYVYQSMSCFNLSVNQD
jgi:hypothetical protein